MFAQQDQSPCRKCNIVDILGLCCCHVYVTLLAEMLEILENVLASNDFVLMIALAYCVNPRIKETDVSYIKIHSKHSISYFLKVSAHLSTERPSG